MPLVPMTPNLYETDEQYQQSFEPGGSRFVGPLEEDAKPVSTIDRLKEKAGPAWPFLVGGAVLIIGAFVIRRFL